MSADTLLADGVHIAHQLDGSVAGCVIAGDGEFRMALWRIWDASLPIWFMGLLNPSRATHLDTDATVTRQVERVRRRGGGGLVIANADPVRETDRLAAVKRFGRAIDINQAWMRWLAAGCDFHIAGWGPDAIKAGVANHAISALNYHDVYALRVNADGSPGHPLYLGYDVEPVLYRKAVWPRARATSQKPRR